MADGRTLTEALAARDVLRMRHSILRRMVDATTPNLRYSRTEIHMSRRLDAAALERVADERAREIRQLDLAIQETSWTSQLQE